MLNYLLAGLLGILAGLVIGIIVLKIINSAKYKKIEKSVLERVKGIEKETLRNAKSARYNLERDVSKKLKQNDIICRKKIRHIERRNAKARALLEKRFNDANAKEVELSKEKELLDNLKKELGESQDECKNKLIEANALIEKASGYTKGEAEKIILELSLIHI